MPTAVLFLHTCARSNIPMKFSTYNLTNTRVDFKSIYYFFNKYIFMTSNSWKTCLILMFQYKKKKFCVEQLIKTDVKLCFYQKI